MRRRLTLAFAGLSVVTLLLYAVPRSIVVADLVRDREVAALDRDIALVSAVLWERMDAGGAVDAAFLDELAAPDERIVVVRPDGTRLAGEAVPEPTRVRTFTAPDGTRIALHLSTEAVEREVRDSLSSVLAIGVAVAGIAALLAFALSRRFVRPFALLAAHVDAAGGDGADAAPRSGLPEADRLADALDEHRDRLASLVREEREFSANASHQLRTPLAALRLRLEDLTLWPEVDDAARTELVAAIAEVDRLSGTISDLLQLARNGGLGAATPVDLAQCAADAADRWRGAFGAAGRQLDRGGDATAVVHTSGGAVLQVLDVLLENALVHGSGWVRLEVAVQDDATVVLVGDEGTIAGEAAEHLFDRSFKSPTSQGSGIGLALARTLAATVGARLRLSATDPTTFELRFPQRRA